MRTDCKSKDIFVKDHYALNLHTIQYVKYLEESFLKIHTVPIKPELHRNFLLWLKLDSHNDKEKSGPESYSSEPLERYSLSMVLMERRLT